MVSNPKIGDAIKKARENKKFTQKELGEIIGKTESSIRKYENGSIEIPLSVLDSIANALEVPTMEIVSKGLKRDYPDADVETVEKLLFYENLCKLYFNGIITWSTDRMIQNIEDSIVLQAHFADVLMDYKTLTEYYVEYTHIFNRDVRISHEYIQASVEEQQRIKKDFFDKALGKQVDRLSYWASIFTTRLLRYKD